MPVVTENDAEPLGTVAGVFLHPDTAAVEGLFVRVGGIFQVATLFLAAADIARWGKRIAVRHPDALCPLDEHVRLTQVHATERPVLGQIVQTEDGQRLGRCHDVQLSTTMLRMEWIFVRRWWRREMAVPAKDILEVRREAVIVRPPLRGLPVPLEKEIVPAAPTFA